jgi:hypothetical protein
MKRLVAALAVVACLTPSWLSAQSVAFTVNAASAQVHKGPSTGSPVIGTARRGAILEVTRELGSWVRVSWPSAEDGIGFVHVSTGALARNTAPDRSQPVASAAARPARVGTSSAATPASGAQRTGIVAQPVPVRPVYVSPSTHMIGIGGRMGRSPFGVGATARVWRRSRLGFQFEMSHSATDAIVVPDRVTSTQFEPSVLYSFSDRISDDFWLRPYVGSGATFARETLTVATGNSVSEGRLGFQAFGGGEITFAGMPRFALSADVSYHFAQAPFVGVDLSGLGVSVAGHWYIR